MPIPRKSFIEQVSDHYKISGHKRAPGPHIIPFRSIMPGHRRGNDHIVRKMERENPSGRMWNA